MKIAVFKPLVICLIMSLIGGSANAQTVKNGTFDDPLFGSGENGHSGDPTYFTTDYTWTPPVAYANTREGQYTVGTVARPWNPYGTNVYGDHTSGSGRYLIVNGSTTPNMSVWQQTISGFTVGQEYSFDGYISNWSGGVPSVVKFMANGGAQGDLISSSPTPNTWFAFERKFTATSSTMTLGLTSLSTSAGGNDFAFDDFKVQAVPEPATTCLVAGAVCLWIRRRRNMRG